VGACNKNGVYYAWNQTNLAAGPVWCTQVAGSESSGAGFCSTSSVWDFANKRLYLAVQTKNLGAGVNGAVYRLDPDTGAILRTQKLVCGVTGTPVVNALTGVLAVGRANCPTGTVVTVRFFDPTAGTPLGSAAAHGDVFAQPVFAEGHLFVADKAGSSRHKPPDPLSQVSVLFEKWASFAL